MSVCLSVCVCDHLVNKLSPKVHHVFRFHDKNLIYFPDMVMHTHLTYIMYDYATGTRQCSILNAFKIQTSLAKSPKSGPALGTFEVFGRTGPPTIGGPPFCTIKIPYKLTLTSPLIAMLTKEPEMLQPGASCEHTMQQHATAAGASLTAIPQTHSWF